MYKNPINSFTLGSFLIPAFVGLVIWSMSYYRLSSSAVQMWDYWGISFYRLFFFTFGLHALLIAIVLSLMFNIGYLAMTRQRPAFMFLWPVIAGGVLVGLIPYDFNSVARNGIIGVFEVPLFWLTVGALCYFLWVKRFG